jgi:hypothetical protein
MEKKMQIRNHVSAQQTPQERRRNPDLRENFDTARTLLKPLLGNPDHHNGAAFYLAMNKLQTSFPHMSGNEIEALVAAVVRSVQTRATGR